MPPMKRERAGDAQAAPVPNTCTSSIEITSRRVPVLGPALSTRCLMASSVQNRGSWFTSVLRNTEFFQYLPASVSACLWPVHRSSWRHLDDLNGLASLLNLVAC